MVLGLLDAEPLIGSALILLLVSLFTVVISLNAFWRNWEVAFIMPKCC